MVRAMRRGLETGLRPGHEGGNLGYGQGVAYELRASSRPYQQASQRYIAKRQSERENESPSRVVAGRHRTSVQLDSTLRNGETEPRTLRVSASIERDSVERLEEMGQRRRRYPVTMILNDENCDWLSAV